VRRPPKPQTQQSKAPKGQNHRRLCRGWTLVTRQLKVLHGPRRQRSPELELAGLDQTCSARQPHAPEGLSQIAPVPVGHPMRIADLHRLRKGRADTTEHRRHQDLRPRGELRACHICISRPAMQRPDVHDNKPADLASKTDWVTLGEPCSGRTRPGHSSTHWQSTWVQHPGS
jgi:hypothetical protein